MRPGGGRLSDVTRRPGGLLESTLGRSRRVASGGTGPAVRNTQLRKRCASLVDQLDVPEPFEVNSFVEALSARRGRPIRLIPTTPPAGICGLWFDLDDADYVLYEHSTSQLHREHIILHELGHMLCSHSPGSEPDLGLVALLVPSLDPATVRRVLGRTGYTKPQEQEAEMLASLILEHVGRTRMLSEVPPEAGGLLGRLESALERPELGWRG